MMRFVARAALLCAVVLSACHDPTAPIDPDLAVVTPGDTLFSAVVASDFHTCALTVGGRAFCWGIGWNGELGISPTPVTCPGEPVSPPAPNGCVNVPTPVAGGLRFTQLSTGLDRTCGLTPSGRLYCWGGARFNGFPGSPVPIPMGGDLRFSAVSVSLESTVVCALGTDGQGYCWGRNDVGQLGIPTGTGQLGAMSSLEAGAPVVGGHRFVTIESRNGTSCGTTATGSLYCWGGPLDTARFDPGTLTFQSCPGGRTSMPCTHVPMKWRGPESWARLVSSGDTCGVTLSGAALCWGRPIVEWGLMTFGRTEAANGSAPPVEPWEVATPTPIRDIVGHPGLYGACAHAVDGRVVCWGKSLTGEFGTGVLSEWFTVPTIVAGGRAFAQIAAGWNHMCGVTTGGEIQCWGNDRWGDLGMGLDVPVQSNGNRGFLGPTRIASIAGK